MFSNTQLTLILKTLCPKRKRNNLTNTSVVGRDARKLTLKYLRDTTRLPSSASSLRPLYAPLQAGAYRSDQDNNAFSVIGPSLWHRLPPSARASLLSSNLSTRTSLSLF